MENNQPNLKAKKTIESNESNESSVQSGPLTAKIPPKALHRAVISEGLNCIKKYWWRLPVKLHGNMVNIDHRIYPSDDVKGTLKKMARMPQVHFWRHFQTLDLCTTERTFYIWGFLNNSVIQRQAYVNSLKHLSIAFPERVQIYGPEYEEIARTIACNFANLQSLSLEFDKSYIMVACRGLANMIYLLSKGLTAKLERFRLSLREMIIDRKFVEEIGFHITKYLVNIKCLELHLTGLPSQGKVSEGFLFEQFSNICNKLVCLEKLSLRYEFPLSPYNEEEVVSYVIKNHVNLKHLKLYLADVGKENKAKNGMLLELISKICSQLVSLEKLEIRLIGFCQIDDKFLKSLVALLSNGPESLKDVTLGFANCEKITSAGLKTFGTEVSKKLNRLNSLCIGFECCPNTFPNDIKALKKKLEKDIKNFTWLSPVL